MVKAEAQEGKRKHRRLLKPRHGTGILLIPPTYWRRHWPTVSALLWMRRDKFTWTTESCGEKGTVGPLSQEESALTLALTGFYWLSKSIHQKRFSFIILRFALGNYFLQIAKERMLLITSYRLTKKKTLQMQGNDNSNWSGYTSILGRISPDFRKLL